jgi:hypothetical protein
MLASINSIELTKILNYFLTAETKRLKAKELRPELMKLLPEEGEIKFSKVNIR